MVIEQAIFGPATQERHAAYALLTHSPGLDKDDAETLAAWCPAHDSLLDAGDDAVSVNFFPLPSGAYCVSKTTPLAWPTSRRSETVTQCLVVSPEVMARYGNHALALLQAAFAQGWQRVHESLPAALEPFRLPGRSPAVDQVLLAGLIGDPGVAWLGALVEAAVSPQSVAVVAGPGRQRLVAALLYSLPVECRLQFSFSTGLKWKAERPYRVFCLGTDPTEHRRLLRHPEVTMVEVNGRPPTAWAPTCGWSGFVSSAIVTGRPAFLAEQLAIARPGLQLTDLNELGNQLLGAMAAEEPPAPDEKVSGTKSGVPKLVPDTFCVPFCVRSDGAHARFESQAQAVALAPRDTQDDPSQVIGHRCPQAIEQLELLDDTVFEAIAGKPGAVDELRTLWPEVLAEVGPALVEESRAQYLRHALGVWRDCVEGDQIRNPALAISVMEVVSLLFEEQKT